MNISPISATNNSKCSQHFGAFKVDSQETLNSVKKLVNCTPLQSFVQSGKSLLTKEGMPTIGGSFLTDSQIKKFEKYSDVYVTMSDFNKIMQLEGVHVGDVYGKLLKLVKEAKLITKQQVDNFVPKIEAARENAKTLEMHARHLLGLE